MRNKGFTIVELLIVIVVIGILSSISVVSYNGVQANARDTARKSDVTAIAKALQLYGGRYGPMTVGSGCGSGGNGNGWFNYEYSPSSMMRCLKDKGTVTSDIIDPSGTKNCGSGDLKCYTYMKYSCILSGQPTTYVYANLETVGHTTTDTDGTCASTIDTLYGMNFFVKFEE